MLPLPSRKRRSEVRRCNLNLPTGLLLPGVRATSGKLGRRTVELRDGTHLKGIMLSRSLRVQTRYGTMVVPLAHIHKADVASDGKSVRVQCRGPDQFAGATVPETTISLKTDRIWDIANWIKSPK